MGDAFEEFTYSAPDGLKLYARDYAAAGDRLPVICLAGLTRNSRDFDALARQLSSGDDARRVIAFDYRGRGRSGRDRDWRNYDPSVEAADLLAGLAALGISRAAFIGTSRGGIIVHLLAAMRPTILAAAVLNDIGPAIEAEGIALILAQLESVPHPGSFAEAATALRQSRGTAFPALLDEDWQRLAAAMYRDTGQGRLEPDYDPRLIKAIRSIDLSRPLPQAWPQFSGLRHVPLLVIRGENSKLLTQITVDRMRASHPRIQAITVPGQGHPPLLETGDLPRQIREFFNSVLNEGGQSIPGKVGPLFREDIA